MSRRDRATIVLGVVIAIGLVAYPLAYRLSRESSAEPAVVEPAVTQAVEASPTLLTPLPTRSAPASIDPSWLAQAMPHLNAIGESFEYVCTPNGTVGPVWGTDVYTADSSVCTAGVHKGMITLEAGGTVRVVMRPGLDIYIGSTRNGVKSDAWDHWDGSYAFVEP